MPFQSTTCQTCHLPKASNSSGRITQWLSTCMCGLEKLPQEVERETIDLCDSCGKRIREGRKGSFTQFIFRSDLCACDVPQHFRPSTAVDSTAEQTAAPVAEEMELDVDPERFPLERYKPIALLGKGSAGTVYLCRDRLLRKRVIVKTLHVSQSNQLVAFHQEAKVLSKLDHPNIVRILDFGATASSTPYMVLDYTPGCSLADHLQKEGTLHWTTAVFLFMSLAAALEYCHRQRVFHRDLKPANVLMTTTDDQSTVKLFDFGVAEIQTDDAESQHATIVGTPSYMSPDQALGIEYDARSEVYAFGCVLFEALTGTPPFTGATALEILSKHAQESPPFLTEVIDEEIPESLEAFVARCLAKSPDERFGSMQEIGHALWSIVQEHDNMVRESNSVAPAEKLISPFHSQRDPVVDYLHHLPLYLKILASITTTVCLTLLSVSFISFFTSPNNTVSEYKFAKVGNYKKPPDLEFVVDSKGGVAVPTDFEDKDIQKLLPYKSKVRLLHMEETNITGACFSELPKFRKLTSLHLADTNVTDDALEDIGKHEQLTYLNISRNKITDAGIKLLIGLDKLQYLAIAETGVTDYGLNSIASMPSLVALRVDSCPRITMAGLNKLKSLESLSANHCSKISVEDLLQFKKQHPNCDVRITDPYPTESTASTFYLCDRYRPSMYDSDFRTFFQTWKPGQKTNTKNPKILKAIRDPELLQFLKYPANREVWKDPATWRSYDANAHADQPPIEF